MQGGESIRIRLMSGSNCGALRMTELKRCSFAAKSTESMLRDDGTAIAYDYKLLEGRGT